jgi:hypothetical protein
MLTVRPATLQDIDEMLRIEGEAWPDGARATRRMLQARTSTFPEGQLCAFANGQMVGHAATQIVRLDLSMPPATWFEATDNGYIVGTHEPDGDTLYGVNMSASNSAQRLQFHVKRLEGYLGWGSKG